MIHAKERLGRALIATLPTIAMFRDSPVPRVYQQLKRLGHYWRPVTGSWVRPYLQKVTVGYLAKSGRAVFTPYTLGSDCAAAAYLMIDGELRALVAVPRKSEIYRGVYVVTLWGGVMHNREWSAPAYIQGCEDEAVTDENAGVSSLVSYCKKHRIGAF